MNISHIALLISDLEKARDFYGRILQLTELKRPSFCIQGLWYQLGDSQLHFMLWDGVEKPQVHPKNITVQPHFSLQVSMDDYHQATTRLSAAGVAFVEEVPDLMRGSLQAFFFDSDVNMIELLAFQ